MESSEKFCLKWNDFETNISSAFRDLREEKDFFDITLLCEDDNQVMAHKVILSACSPFFRNILRRNSHQHPLLYLKGVKYKELLAVLNFMYQGEVSVAQEELNIFLTVAEDLRVKGLTQSKQPNTQSNIKSKVNKPTESIQPQLKRSRIAPASTPITPKRSSHSSSTYYQGPEVEEYVPVKVEPRDPSQQTNQLQPEPFQSQDLECGNQTGGEAGIEHGAVALDDAYADDEACDYQYTGEVYPQDNVTDMANDDSNKGKAHYQVQIKTYNITTCNVITNATNSLSEKKSQRIAKNINSKPNSKTVKKESPRDPIKMVGNGYSQAWQCEICQKISSSRKNAVLHIKEDHS